jgi:PAS domain S-box-containing protein
MSSKTRKFESLLEAVPDALVGMDQAGDIRFVNHQTESLFGYERDNLVGQPIQTLAPSRSMGLDLRLSGRQQTELSSRSTSVCPTSTSEKSSW